MRLLLTVTDCPRPAGTEERGAARPELPALSLILSRARAAPGVVPWQLRVGALLAPRTPSTPASLAAASVTSAARDVWMAQPVALFAATDHLRLPKGGLLRLDAEQGAALAEDFSRVFGSDGLALHPLADGGFVLTGLAGKGGAVEPARIVGTRVEAAARSGDAGVRKLASEIELWLHEHPVNLRRMRRGEPAITSLWLWGGGEPVSHALREEPPPSFVAGAEPVVLGAAALAGLEVRPAPPSLDALPDIGNGLALVQVSAREGLEPLEAAWFAPALARVRSRSLDGLRLLILDTDAELTPARSWQLWRRSRPWWDTLSR